MQQLREARPDLARQLLALLLTDGHDLDARWLTARLAGSLAALDTLAQLRAWALDPVCTELLLHALVDAILSLEIEVEAFLLKLLDVESGHATLLALDHLARLGTVTSVPRVQAYERALYAPVRRAARLALEHVLARVPPEMSGAISLAEAPLAGSLSAVVVESQLGPRDVLLERK